MGRKLKFVGFDKINKYIDEKEDIIIQTFKNPVKFEYSRTFGKAIYHLKIKQFIEQFRLNKNISYALKTFNLLSTYECINEFIERTKLKNLIEHTQDQSTYKNQALNKFYSFVSILTEDNSNFSKEIQERIFQKYFLHYYLWVRADKGREINYQDMVKYLLKGKIADVKEQYKQLEDKVIFNLIFNGELITSLEGKSIKTLRKKAYKKLFFYILENQDVLYSVRIK